MFQLFGDGGFVFGLRVLPMIIFVTALIAVLYYIGVMKWIVAILGAALAKVLGVSRIEACSAVATIFLGQSEMPALVKPFVRNMTSAEIFTVMASGMASVAAPVLVGYAGLGVRMEYLLAASFMAVPGGLLFGKLLYPTVEPSRVVVDGRLRRQAGRQRDRGGGVRRVGRAADRDQRRRDADRVRETIALMNLIVGGVAAFAGFPQITLVGIIGHLFAPLAWIIGVPWHDAALAGNFIGEKLIFNEFVAYGDLSPYLKGGAHVAAAGLQVLDPKTLAIVSFALCGFANFSSIAILAGGFSAVAPERRSEVARHGLRALTAATLSNLMSAAIAGLFFSLH